MSLNILPYIFTRFAALPVQRLNKLIIPDTLSVEYLAEDYRLPENM
jgi:hypothetical protein